MSSFLKLNKTKKIPKMTYYCNSIVHCWKKAMFWNSFKDSRDLQRITNASWKISFLSLIDIIYLIQWRITSGNFSKLLSIFSTDYFWNNRTKFFYDCFSGKTEKSIWSILCKMLEAIKKALWSLVSMKINFASSLYVSVISYQLCLISIFVWLLICDIACLDDSYTNETKSISLSKLIFQNE